MAEYKTIKGFQTQSYATDPTPATAAWSSGPSLSNGRQGNSGAGLQTAAITMGGVVPPGGAALAKTETYDGTSWTEVNNLTTGRISNGSVGILTAAICFGGYIPPPNAATGKTETWNGTCWSEQSDLTTARYSTGSGGTTTAAVCAGGNPGKVALSEEWDGTSWAEGNNLNNARAAMGWANQGTETAALVYGGGPGGDANNESYDGTCWTELANLNTAMQTGAGAGTSTLALYFGGANPGQPPSVGTESWDGTSWTEVAELATGRGDLGGCGTAAAAIAIGGPPGLTTTEIWNDHTATNPAPSLTMMNEGQIWYNTTGAALKYTTVAAGTWASGGTLPANYFSMGASGTLAAGLAYGGQGGNTGTYTYSSSTWSTSPATLNNGRHNIVSSGIGTSTAAQCMGGEIPAPPNYGVFTEQFNGSAWTEVAAPGGSLNTGRYGSAGGGTQTAAILSMGTTGSGTDATETWNGSSWTTGTAAPQAKWYVAGGGPQSDFITAGGTNSAPTSVATSDYWNGTSWTEVADLNTNRILAGRAAGAGTSAIIFGGETPPAKANTEKWDGTSWTEVADLSTPASAKAGSGTASLAFGVGNASPNNGATEEWDETVLTVKTVTVS